MYHVDRSPHFVIDSVKLSEDNAVDSPGVAFVNCEVNQGTVELSQLVDRVIACEGLTNEEHNVWLVDMHKFSQLAHQFFVSLHPASRVNQHHVVLLVPRLLKRFFSNNCWVVLVTLFIKRNVEAGSVDLKLLDGPAAEIVAARQHHFQVTLSL